MRRFFASCVALSVAACAPQPRLVMAPGSLPFLAQKGAISGQRQRVNFLTSINPDCTEIGARIELSAPPSHGSVEFAPGRDFPSYSPGNPRSKCNDRRVPGTVVYYTSEPGYRGPDTFRTKVLTESGFLNDYPLTIQVQ